MNDSESNREQSLHASLRALNRRVHWLTVTVALLVLAVLVLAADVFATLVNYYEGDPLLFGGGSILSALLGFAVGWFARKRV